MKRSPSHPQLLSKEIIWNCRIVIIPSESQTKIHLDGVESNNMDAGAAFVSVVCILELMQCLSQVIARVVNRSQNTRDFQFSPRIKAKISEYASNYAVSNYA